MTFAPTRTARRPFRLGLLRRLLAPRPTARPVETLPRALLRDIGLADRR